MEAKKENRGKKFIKDFGIYSIGILGTRIITFLMIPLYTYCLDNTADYGIYDMCLQICMFLLPVSTLQMRDASFRFLIETDSEERRKTVVTIVYKILFSNLLFIVSLGITLSLFFHIHYFYYSVALLVSITLHEVIGQIIRGLKRNKVYVACNLLNALLIGSLSCLFVAVLQMGVKGVFLANIISRFVAGFVMELKVGVFCHYFHFNVRFGEISKTIFKYALPLIPTSMCWLLTTISDRFFISYFVSYEANGIYAVIIRFAMILQTLALIFYQAWQETAITQYKTSDKNSFFSKVFNYYFFALSILMVSFTFLVKMNYTWLVAPNYYSGIKYLYCLGAISILMSLSSSFFELGYQCGKDTKRAIPALFFAAVINVSLNFLITPHFGVKGVIISNFFTFLFLCIYRYFDTKRYFRISIYKSTLLLPFLLIAGAFMFTFSSSVVYDLLCLLTLVVAFLLFAPKELELYAINFIKLKLKKE